MRHMHPNDTFVAFPCFKITANLSAIFSSQSDLQYTKQIIHLIARAEALGSALEKAMTVLKTVHVAVSPNTKVPASK